MQTQQSQNLQGYVFTNPYLHIEAPFNEPTITIHTAKKSKVVLSLAEAAEVAEKLKDIVEKNSR